MLVGWFACVEGHTAGSDTAAFADSRVYTTYAASSSAVSNITAILSCNSDSVGPRSSFLSSPEHQRLQPKGINNSGRANGRPHLASVRPGVWYTATN